MKVKVGHCVRFKEGSQKIAQGVVCKTTESPPKKLLKKNPVLIQTNTLRWISENDIIEDCGPDFWFNRKT